LLRLTVLNYKKLSEIKKNENDLIYNVDTNYCLQDTSS
jgi:hypothetical protein